MTLLTIDMQVIQEKRKELIHAVVSLMAVIRCQPGCLRCDCYSSIEDPDQLCFRGEWDCRENLIVHLQSDHFKIMLGAMSLMQRPHEIRIHTAANSRETETLLRAAGL